MRIMTGTTDWILIYSILVIIGGAVATQLL